MVLLFKTVCNFSMKLIFPLLPAAYRGHPTISISLIFLKAAPCRGRIRTCEDHLVFAIAVKVSAETRFSTAGLPWTWETRKGCCRDGTRTRDNALQGVFNCCQGLWQDLFFRALPTELLRQRPFLVFPLSELKIHHPEKRIISKKLRRW